MVLVNGIKYACERCIRGHRVTTCNHTDQPLMMIKPKGRPSTTCSHCKELRKNKNANPSGSCTCGRQEKKRLAQKVKEEARSSGKGTKDVNCDCIESDKCSCHRTRKTHRRMGSSKTKGTAGSSVSITSGDSPTLSAVDGPEVIGRVGKNQGLSSIPSFHSSQSLDRDFSLGQSPPFSPSLYNNSANNWETSSITSSLLSESRLNLVDRGYSASVPIPEEQGPDGEKTTLKGNKSRGDELATSIDKVPETHNHHSGFESFGFQNRIGWAQNDTKHGNMDLFADTSEFGNTNYRTLKQHHHTKGPGHPSMDKVWIPESPHSTAITSRSTSFHREVPKTLTSRPSIDSASSDFSRFTISGTGYKERPVASITQSQQPQQPYITARQLQSQHSFLGTDALHPTSFDMKDENSQSVEVLSLTPSFMDIPDNSNLYSATSNPFLNSQGGAEIRQRSVSIHRNHRYDQFSKQQTSSRSHLSLSDADHTMKNDQSFSNPSRREGVNTDPTVPPRVPVKDSPPTYNDAAATMSPPRNGLMTRPMEPASSFTSDFDDILGYNTNDDTHSLLSRPSINLDLTTNTNADNLSMSQNAQLSPTLFSETVGDFSFNDIDKLMSDP
ncbi:LAFA_0C08064g1_1 [Lachancea sp. 'fantastica']|nr:LAFA_0C08064g1_1 [Lachancea sp. 'fantastica']